jgi:hypothetical protein
MLKCQGIRVGCNDLMFDYFNLTLSHLNANYMHSRHRFCLLWGIETPLSYGQRGLQRGLSSGLGGPARWKGWVSHALVHETSARLQQQDLREHTMLHITTHHAAGVQVTLTAAPSQAQRRKHNDRRKQQGMRAKTASGRQHGRSTCIIQELGA